MKIFITKEAQKQYFHLNESDKSKINKKLSLLKKDPLSGKKLLGELAGTRSLKAWPYRIIYTVDSKHKEIWIVSLLHRQGAY